MGYREEYQSWLTRFAADPDTVAELQSIAKDEKEIEDRFYTELAFGTGGLRGVLGMGTQSSYCRARIWRVTSSAASGASCAPSAAYTL